MDKYLKLRDNKKLRPIMFVGTGSDVGKSVINAGFCRVFLQDGYHPAPFKAQNMSLNSYSTKDNLEIGRAQAVQAEACGIDCMVEMNPILLKPTDNCTSQIVLNGKPFGNKSASEYFNDTDRMALFEEVMTSFDRLYEKYNPIVIEGAGSISEMNLWDKDIVNMRVALRSGASTFLIADIDRGGVFGSVYGSLKLLPKDEYDNIKGIIINKFRGDIRLFDKGREMLQEITGKPVVGVIPYFRDIMIEQEDSVDIDYKLSISKDKVNIAVVLLEHMSNFTDFNILKSVKGVNLYYSDDPKKISDADIIIIPGTKNTISDLKSLKRKGLDKVIYTHYLIGKSLYGICGGYQILGKTISDPYGVEGEPSDVEGIGIFPTNTILTKEKKVCQCQFNFCDSSISGQGYEIHMGKTDTDKPLCILDDGSLDGYYLNEKVWGSYIHGIFDNASVIESVLTSIGKEIERIDVDYKKTKEEAYNKLADVIRENVDLDYIYSTLYL